MTLPAVVFAGGLGTRLASVTEDRIPKVMVAIDGRPFIDFKLAHLAANGVEEVILLVGHLGDRVRAHVGDRWCGLRVTYVEDGPVLLGTGGALRRAAAVLPDRFFATYGDSYLPVDLAPIERSHEAAGLRATMTVKRNRDAGGPSNVTVARGRVTRYDRHPTPGTYEFIDYGLLVLAREDVERLPVDRPADLSVVFDDLIADEQLGAHEVIEDFYEVGTPDRLERARTHLADDGLWARLHTSIAKRSAGR